MKKEKLKVIKQADITNNCPECFNQEMKLTFYQKHTYGRFFHRITNQVSNQIQCMKCQSIIYPINWTDDIERIVDYYQKMVTPKPASVKFTALFYATITLIVLAIVAAIYLRREGII